MKTFCFFDIRQFERIREFYIRQKKKKQIFHASNFSQLTDKKFCIVNRDEINFLSAQLMNVSRFERVFSSSLYSTR